MVIDACHIWSVLPLVLLMLFYLVFSSSARMSWLYTVAVQQLKMIAARYAGVVLDVEGIILNQC